MKLRSPSVHLESVRRPYKDKVYVSHLLRTTYREGGKVKHQTLANLSGLPDQAIDTLRRSLQGKPLVPLDEAVRIRDSRAHGSAAAVLGLARQTGLDRMLLSTGAPWKRLLLAMIAARVLQPGSKLFTVSWWQTTTLPELLDLPGHGEDPGLLYDALDHLVERQDAIQRKLAAKHLNGGMLVLYDVSSSYVEGAHCPLAAYGYNRDGKKGKKQIVYGLITTPEGCPIAIEVFEGNTADPLTVSSQVRRLREEFGLVRVVVVGDRGMLTSNRLPELEEQGYGWITALRAPAIQKLAEQRVVQLSLFDQRDVAEVQDPERPDERLVVCRNPLVAEERGRKRAELLAATERDLAGVQRRVERGRLKDPGAIGVAAGRVLNRWKMAKHFTLEIGVGSFSFQRNEAGIQREAVLDGLYVIRSNVPAEEMTAEQVVDGYKGLKHVEQAFRSLKTAHLEVRPIYHRLERRVRAHAFLCMLAYYLVWHLRRALQPLLEETPRRGLQAVLDELSTLQRHHIDISGAPACKVTEATEQQSEVFRLLGLPLPT